MEELKAPFEQDPEIAAAFDLLDLKDVTAVFPAWTDYQQDGDLLKLTDAVTGMLLSVVGPIFRQVRIPHSLCTALTYAHQLRAWILRSGSERAPPNLTTICY